MPMAGPWGSSSADSQQSGPATTKVVGGALTSASARGCPLRAAADETARQHRGQRQAQGSFCGHARSCRTQDRSRQAPGGARGSTESLVPAGETREASISPDLWHVHVFRVLCDSPSSGHQAQRHRSRRHARAAENVWQPCRASGCRSDPCLAPRSRALRCICILVAGAPPAVHLTAPPRDTAGAFSTHPRCLSTPYMRILAISGRLRRFWRGDPLSWAGGPFCHMCQRHGPDVPPEKARVS